MAKIGLFYGSTSGDTLKAAEMIAAEFGDGSVELQDVRKASAADLAGYDAFIFGTSTWHWGGLQDEWAVFEEELGAEQIKGKKIALFGLGDQKNYPENFVDGIGLLGKKVKSLGALLVGHWPTEGYDFIASQAVSGKAFLGLALDQDNQAAQTPDRIRRWVRQLKEQLV
ncbi:MAG: flavodoxin [Sedimentisphaerales bacterium]|nr:flavodoxin [Sedimentisphaerales bacterium]